MSDTILFRPLRAWPTKSTPSWQREKWPSAVTLTKALDSLKQQLRLLGCDATAYIEADVSEKHIRQDGQLYATARAATPGIIVSAKHRRLGDLRWMNDHYQSFEQNIRAVALTIQNLRAIERYGCVRDNEQFTGFKAIPARSTETMSRETAIGILARHAGFAMSNPSDDQLRHGYRVARSRAHPDRNGGDQSAWDAVEVAARILGLSN